jgi:hypothetical protein
MTIALLDRLTRHCSTPAMTAFGSRSVKSLAKGQKYPLDATPAQRDINFNLGQFSMKIQGHISAEINTCTIHHRVYLV